MPTPEEIAAQKEKEEKAEKEKEALALAEAKKTEKEKEPMIPKSRLDEEIQKAKEAREALAILQKEQAKQREAQLAEQGKYKELVEEHVKTIAELQPKADRVDSMMKTEANMLAAQIEELPETAQGYVPSKLSVQDQLEWLGEHKTDFMKPLPPDLKAGKRGGGENGSVDLNSEELAMASAAGMTPEEYAKYK